MRCLQQFEIYYCQSYGKLITLNTNTEHYSTIRLQIRYNSSTLHVVLSAYCRVSIADDTLLVTVHLLLWFITPASSVRILTKHTLLTRPVRMIRLPEGRLIDWQCDTVVKWLDCPHAAGSVHMQPQHNQTDSGQANSVPATRVKHLILTAAWARHIRNRIKRIYASR